MFTDYYLKFSNEAECRATLFEKVAIAWEQQNDPEAEPVATEWEERPRFRNIDILPLVVDQAGTYDEEGAEITPPVYVDGYHANVRALDGEPVDLIEPFKINVNSPARVWA
jgi:hypothetical protein